MDHLKLLERAYKHGRGVVLIVPMQKWWRASVFPWDELESCVSVLRIARPV